MKTNKDSWKITDKDVNRLKDGAGCDVDTFATLANIEWIIAGIELAQKRLMKWLDKNMSHNRHYKKLYGVPDQDYTLHVLSSEDWERLCEEIGP